MTHLVLDQAQGEAWSAYHADCVTFAQGLPDSSVDFSVFSPPFSSLYVYSESVADMGNVGSDEEFFVQYGFLVRELYRVLRPGRCVAIHVKDLPQYRNSSDDGSAGLRPFSDGCTAVHRAAGFTFHCRIAIYRDPVLERAKTNAHGLLWKTFQQDSTFCRVGMPEYLMVYRKWAKPGEDELVRPVVNPRDQVPLTRWQDLASPVWTAHGDEMDATLGYPWPCIWNMTAPGQGDGGLPATDVLNVEAARGDKDEKHLCPMPLNITERALQLYSSPGDVVFSPFMGIGSEGVASLRLGRRFLGTELHPSYFRQALKYLHQAEREAGTLLGLMEG